MDLLTPDATTFSFDTHSYKAKIGRLAETIRARLRRLLRRHALFHLFSWALLAAEAVILFTLFPFWMKSPVAAYGLGIFFLSIFSYLALRLYLQGKKPEQFQGLVDLYLQSCKGLIHYQEGLADHHLALAEAACKLANTVAEKQPPRLFRRPLPFWERLSSWAYSRDTLAMQELLLHSAIDEYIHLVRCEPTHLEVHAALANAYVMLSSLYSDPKHTIAKWFGERERMAYQKAAKAAVEEFRILQAFAPDDPWVYTQLAYCYHDLHMIDEEIEAYEKILELRPSDFESQFRLGMRYFEKGENAKGLRIYQELKRRRYRRAQSLLVFYGGNT